MRTNLCNPRLNEFTQAVGKKLRSKQKLNQQWEK